MRDGHPFDTPALDELRVSQRRMLRTLPEAYVRRATRFRIPTAPDYDRALIETVLRSGIEDLLTAEDRQVITKLEPFASSSSAQFVDSIEIGHLDPAFETLMKVSNAIRSRMNLAQPDGPVPFEQENRLMGVALLLIAADELATDEYVDARVAESRRSMPE